MLAALSDDQRLLVETVAQIAGDLETPTPRSLPVGDGGDRDWATLCATGLVGMHLSAAAGGGDAHSADVALAVEQFGRRTSVAPFLGQAVLAPELARVAQAPQELLTAMVSGDARVTVALSSDLRRVARVGEDAVAWDARGATHALLLTPDQQVALAAVDAASIPQADLTRQQRRVDLSTTAQPIGAPLRSDDLVRIEAFMLAMLGADLVGVMQDALDAAVAYVGSRVQFGVPVGSFQAVQHLAAEGKVLLEGSRSALWYTAWAADELDPHEALLAARQCKAYTSAAALEVVEVQTQLFGGIALTWEEQAHIRTRRVLHDRVVLGDDGTHLDAIAETRLGRTD